MLVLSVVICMKNTMLLWSSQPSDVEGSTEKCVNGVRKAEKLNINMMQNIVT